jgi:arylsulfatase
MYFCTGAMHAPHHVPKDGADKYNKASSTAAGMLTAHRCSRSRRRGIEPANTKLSRHDPDVQDWEKLPADERRLYARMMEVFAGFLEHTDHYIGELIAFLKDLGQYENTLIMVISTTAPARGGRTAR